MSYELEQLMKQYGVSTPTMSYTGSDKPVMPVAPAAGTTAADLEAARSYNALLAKYNAAMPQYQADQQTYDTYKNDYQNRLANTPMYGVAQYNTRPNVAASTPTQVTPATSTAPLARPSYTPIGGVAGVSGVSGFTPLPMMELPNVVQPVQPIQPVPTTFDYGGGGGPGSDGGVVRALSAQQVAA